MRILPVVTVALALLVPLASACSPDPVAPPPATAVASTSAPVTASATASAAPGAAATVGAVAIGAPPPDFSATASDGTAIHLSALKGKPVVVYFYPKDETPGCTTEACSFRDAWTALSAKGVVLIGISADSDDSHRAFAKNHQLPFLLVSDTSGAIAQKFGVPTHDGYIARQSFVIGADGKVKNIYRKVDVAAHAAQIAADVQ
jgi:thioredoxin-dependent peroxiredoxin